MKPLKMFVLAALAALMAMAFVGASSAMAETTALCTSDATTCETITHVHEATLSGHKGILLATPKIECDVLFLGDTVAGTSAPLEIHGKFGYSNCGSGCTVTEESAFSTIEVLKTGHETAKVVGEGEVHVNCVGINCFYNGEELEGTSVGPLLSTETNGETSVEEKTVKKTKGTLCPASGKLDLLTTPLEPTYIHGGLGYCVKTEHKNGIYTDSTCRTLGSPAEHKYEYTLVIGPAGRAVNETVCYDVLLPLYGLWKKINAVTGACEEDDSANTWLYEKGIIVTVE